MKLTLALLFGFAALPAATTHDRVDSLFSTWDVEGSPGAAVAVIKDGEIVVADGYGSSQIEYDVPITPETIFHVASVSKQFTSFAICLLAADGALSLDDPIQKHLEEVPDFGATITLRHLMHHTSGLRDQWEALCVAGWRMDDVITTEHVLTLVANQRELNFEPGSQWMYCNTGYTLLGEVVARVSGQSFPEFCEERMFEPLGMEATHFHDDHERVVPQRAYSYERQGEGYRNAVLSYANAGATSLFTTAIDLCFWLQNLGSGEVGGPEVQAMMRETYVLNDGTPGTYAMGLILEESQGHRTISHSGGDAGFRSHATWYPDQELGVVVLANIDSVQTDVLANRVAMLFAGDPPPREAAPASASAQAAPAAAPKATPPSEGTPRLEDYVGRYWSEELGTFYDVLVVEDRIVAKHRRHGTILLTQANGDSYDGDRWFFGRVEFAREDGRVTSFRLQGGRVRNLYFERQPLPERP